MNESPGLHYICLQDDTQDLEARQTHQQEDENDM